MKIDFYLGLIVGFLLGLAVMVFALQSIAQEPDELDCIEKPVCWIDSLQPNTKLIRT